MRWQQTKHFFFVFQFLNSRKSVSVSTKWFHWTVVQPIEFKIAKSIEIRFCFGIKSHCRLNDRKKNCCAQSRGNKLMRTDFQLKTFAVYFQFCLILWQLTTLTMEGDNLVVERRKTEKKKLKWNETEPKNTLLCVPTKIHARFDSIIRELWLCHGSNRFAPSKSHFLLQHWTLENTIQKQRPS